MLRQQQYFIERLESCTQHPYETPFLSKGLVTIDSLTRFRTLRYPRIRTCFAIILLLLSLVSTLSLLADPVLDIIYIRKAGPILVKTGHLWLRNAFLVVIGICFLIPAYEAINLVRSYRKLTLWHICKQYLMIMLRLEEFQLLKSLVRRLTKVAVGEDSGIYWVSEHREELR